MKTYLAKKEDVKRDWVIVDVKDVVLGRAATEIAAVLRGKHRPTFTPHVDAGDFVVVINASKIILTGNKWDDKMYYDHSGYMGGLKERTANEMKQKHPDEMIKRAVKGMLPKNKLSRHLLTKLKVYADEKHPHHSQQPKELKLNN